MNVLDRETIDSLINKFKNYITSHPNISKLWIETLELLKNKNENKNKKEICSDRIRNRDQLTTGTSNPFMIQNNYLDDLSNQDIYLRPQDSNIKNNENKYLKMDYNK